MQSVFPIFVSSGRAGLTLLEVIFESHPEIAVAHEPRFLAPMVRQRRRYEGSGGIDLDRFTRDLFGYGNFRRLGLSREEVVSALAEGQPEGFADAVRCVLALYAASRNKSRYAVKSPLAVSYLEPIAEVFPEVRFVHLVRDGRDVVLAYLERDKGPSSIAEGAFHWRLRTSRGHEAGLRLGPERYRHYKYEDLVDDPEGTVRQICEFLDLDYDPVMLDYHETAANFLAGAKNPKDHQHLTLAPTKGLIDWRNTMSAEDLALFETIGGDLLAELGYERAAGRRVPRLVVAVEWLRWQMRRITWRIKWRLTRR